MRKKNGRNTNTMLMSFWKFSFLRKMNRNYLSYSTLLHSRSGVLSKARSDRVAEVREGCFSPFTASIAPSEMLRLVHWDEEAWATAHLELLLHKVGITLLILILRMLYFQEDSDLLPSSHIVANNLL